MESNGFILDPPPPPLPPGLYLSNISDASSFELGLIDHFNKVSTGNVLRHESPRSRVRLLVQNLHRSQSQEETENHSSVFVSFFKVVSPIIQVGPSCGLVALSMAGQLLNGCNLDVDRVMSAAVEHGYTRQGEMFSADNLMSLALQLVPSCSGKLLLPEVSRCDKLRTICDTLAHGGAVLLPYDRDSNNGPCLKQGCRAHWALLTGVLLSVNPCDLATATYITHEPDPDLSGLQHATCDEQSSLDLNSWSTYVFVVHGRSTRTSLWSLDELLESNDQLNNMDPKKQFLLPDGDVKAEFVLPAGGVKSGLCGKVILLTKSKYGML